METKKINAVANEFLAIPNNDITLLKLLKLCYIAQGFSLAILDRPIFDNEIEAWRYGPVIPALYHEFKHFGSEKIDEKSQYSYLDDNFNFISEIPTLTNDEDKKIIQIVWNLYGIYSGGDLVDMTHRSGTPWDLTYIPNANNVIPHRLIKEYYKILINQMKKR